MAKFCSGCGAALIEGAKFCQSCGAPLPKPEPKRVFCSKCGAELKVGVKFCEVCGTPVTQAAHIPTPAPEPVPEPTPEPVPEPESEPTPEPTPEPESEPESEPTPESIPEPEPQPEPEIKQEPEPTQAPEPEPIPEPIPEPEPVFEPAPEPVSEPAPEPAPEPKPAPRAFSFAAPSFTGEAILGSVGGKALGAVSSVVPGPGRVIASSGKSFVASLKSTLKDPKKMIPTLVIAVIWIVLDILKSCGINPVPTQILSFLTFANGGMNGGFFGAMFGIVGKGIFAGALVSLIGLFAKRNKGQKRSFADTLKGAFGVSLDTLGAYLAGVGAAIFFFLLISGGAARISFMGGIATSFLAARAALQNGFLRRFISSITSKGKPKAGPGAAGFIRGISVGSAAAAFIGLIGINLILIILGGVILTGGVVLAILQATGVIKSGKEASAR